MDPYSLLVSLLIVVLIVAVLFWIIGQSFPANVAQIAKLCVGVLALFVVLGLFFGRLPWIGVVHR